MKTEISPKEFSAILTRLFEDRQSVDSDLSGLVTAEDARRDVEDAKRFLDAIRARTLIDKAIALGREGKTMTIWPGPWRWYFRS